MQVQQDSTACEIKVSSWFLIFWLSCSFMLLLSLREELATNGLWAQATILLSLKLSAKQGIQHVHPSMRQPVACKCLRDINRFDGILISGFLVHVDARHPLASCLSAFSASAATRLVVREVHSKSQIICHGLSESGFMQLLCLTPSNLHIDIQDGKGHGDQVIISLL